MKRGEFDAKVLGDLMAHMAKGTAASSSRTRYRPRHSVDYNNHHHTGHQPQLALTGRSDVTFP